VKGGVGGGVYFVYSKTKLLHARLGEKWRGKFP
jgi:hypothetical protein